jgi:hypothetical protein
MDSCGISTKRRQLEMFWQNLPDCSIILSSLKKQLILIFNLIIKQKPISH